MRNNEDDEVRIMKQQETGNWMVTDVKEIQTGSGTRERINSRTKRENEEGERRRGHHVRVTYRTVTTSGINDAAVK